MKHLCTAAALAALVLAGCRTGVAPSVGLGDPYPPPFNDPQISVLSPKLHKWLAFHPARIEMDSDKPMQVEVPVRNLTKRNYQIDYRFLFFDKHDMELRPTMAWRFANLSPKQIVRLRAGALSTEAINYRLEVKWAG